MKVCQSCGYENNDNAKFCAECGIQFLNTIFVCKSCGQTYEKMVKYCSECGTLIQTDANQPFFGFAEEILLTKELDFSHKAVDLGLSVKWADRNIGASSPTEKGDYFAWGELKPKSYYGEDNYKWYCNGRFLRPGGLKSIVGSEYDIAHVMWGDRWRMPTPGQFKELMEKCTWERINQTCFKVIGINGNSIILPETGIFEESDILLDYDDYRITMYWAASLVDKKEYEKGFSYSFTSIEKYDEVLASGLYLESDLEDPSLDPTVNARPRHVSAGAACERYTGLNVRAVL